MSPLSPAAGRWHVLPRQESTWDLPASRGREMALAACTSHEAGTLCPTSRVRDSLHGVINIESTFFSPARLLEPSAPRPCHGAAPSAWAPLCQQECTPGSQRFRPLPSMVWASLPWGSPLQPQSQEAGKPTASWGLQLTAPLPPQGSPEKHKHPGAWSSCLSSGPWVPHKASIWVPGALGAMPGQRLREQQVCRGASRRTLGSKVSLGQKEALHLSSQCS